MLQNRKSLKRVPNSHPKSRRSGTLKVKRKIVEFLRSPLLWFSQKSVQRSDGSRNNLIILCRSGFLYSRSPGFPQLPGRALGRSEFLVTFHPRYIFSLLLSVFHIRLRAATENSFSLCHKPYRTILRLSGRLEKKYTQKSRVWPQWRPPGFRVTVTNFFRVFRAAFRQFFFVFASGKFHFLK